MAARFAGRRDEHPGNVFALHQLDVEIFLVYIFVGVAQENGVMVGQGHIFNGANQRREKGILNI